MVCPRLLARNLGHATHIADFTWTPPREVDWIITPERQAPHATPKLAGLWHGSPSNSALSLKIEMSRVIFTGP